MEYPQDDPPGLVFDYGLGLLEEAERTHREPEAVANRVRIGLGLRHVGMECSTMFRREAWLFVLSTPSNL
jgi:hypothetical protein